MNVLITGASKGIGNALSKEFARHDNNSLFLLSRSEEALKELKEACLSLNPKTEVHLVPFDLTRLEKEDLPATLSGVHFDVIINNAGFLIKKNFELLQPADIYKVLSTNFVAPALLISKTLTSLGGNSPTHIVNMGSMGGYQGSLKFPGLSVYSASKAALACLTECLAQELKGRNIFVNCLAIGSVQTEMLSKAFPGYQAPLMPEEMATYIVSFATEGYKFFNGKVLPVSLSTP